MKRSFLSAMLAVGVLGMGGAEAQITLLQTLQGYYYPMTATLITGNDFNGYYPMQGVTSPIRFYNEDFSVRASVNISAPSGYQISGVGCISEKAFNTDSKLEFTVTFAKTTTDANAMNTHTIVRLYDEDGNVLKDLGTGYIISPALTIMSNGNYRLHVIKYNYPETGSTVTYTTEIYSLPGRKEVSSVAPQIRETRDLAYKLKEGETATMKIYNIKGQVVDTKLIDHTFNKIRLNTARYPRGTYIYKINGRNAKKFVLK